MILSFIYLYENTISDKLHFTNFVIKYWIIILLQNTKFCANVDMLSIFEFV